MDFRNKVLVDKRFTQIKSKVKKLDIMVARGQSTQQDFRNGLKDLYETVEDLETLIERETQELRNG